MKIGLGYPSAAEEVLMLDRFHQDDPLERLEPVSTPEQMARLQEARRRIRVAPELKRYIAAIVQATRSDARVKYGVSPRGTLFLMRAAQALAAVRGRDFVLPDDVKELGVPVLAHRLILKPEERLRGVDPGRIVADVLDMVPIQPDSR